ncbi:MAG TPA: signal peptide peptidase SppA [Micavibrio sp.]
MIRRICTFLGAVILICIATGIVISARMAEKKEPVPDQMVLTLRLQDGLKEQSADSNIFAGIDGLSSNRLSVHEMVDTLDKASRDNRVKALAVSLESGEFGVSSVQELRAAVKRFRSSGKPAYIFSPSYAEAGIGMGAYYLASAFDQIWMQPVGSLALPGYDAEMPFALDGLKKIGVSPQFFHRKEYKTVMENVSRDSMSPENREMTTSLLTDILSIIATDISADRKIDFKEVYADINQGIFTDREALDKKLVDRLDYGDVLLTELRKTVAGKPDGQDVELVAMGRYRDFIGKPDVKGLPQIGFVSAVGNIVSGNGGGSISKEITAADKVSGAIMKGVADKNIKVILLRIDSPGGSPTASETIRRAVEYSVSKGKPVIVSMGGMAGSGGYWIATHATRIFATPSTLTGSIGVASGKFEASGLMDKIGINWDGVQLGKNADMWSFTGPFSESGQERMNTLIDSMYGSFISRVAEGRKLTPDQVEKIARGRVWTGHQALGLGLVDELGGLDIALDYAAKQAGAQNRDQVAIVELPRARTPFDRIFELLDIEVAMDHFAGAAMGMLEEKVNEARMPKVEAYDPLLEHGF